VNESDIYVPYCLTEAEAKVSATCFDLCTTELLRELLIRLWNTNGVEFCPEDDLFSAYNEIEHELQRRGSLRKVS